MAQEPEDAIAETDRVLDARIPDWRERSQNDFKIGRARIAVLRMRTLLWFFMKSTDPLGIFATRPGTPDLAAQGVVHMSLTALSQDSGKDTEALDAFFDSIRADWRDAFAQDLPWGTDLRITVGRLLGQAMLLTEGETASPLEHIWQVADGGPNINTPEGAAQATAIMFARLLSGTTMLT
jgi:hypothetical protein